MKTTIEIAVSKTVVKTETRGIDFPEVEKYYRKHDGGNFFPRGIVLFAIIPIYPGKTAAYHVVEVERNKQDFNDFWPSKDCRQEYWLSSSIRKTAFDIITKSDHEFKEITKEEFEAQRIELLNQYKKEEE